MSALPGEQRPRRIDDVVEDDAVLAFDVPDNLKDFGFVVSLSVFVHDGEIGADHHRELLCSFGSAHVRRNDHQVLDLQGAYVVGEDGARVEGVYGDGEEPWI